MKGVFSVVPTPFAPDGAIDMPSLQRLTRFLIQTGVNGLTALGVTSEAAKLSDQERAEVLECIFNEAHGRVPIVVGATADTLAIAIERCRSAHAAGATAVMVAPPPTRQANAEKIRNHFSALADAVEIGIVLQDYPVVSGFSMEAELLVQLAQEIPTICAIKLEDPPTAPKILALKSRSAGAALNIFGGLGGAFLFEELLAGSTGAMTGFAFPELLIAVIREYEAGRIEAAADIFYRYLPVLRLEAQEKLGLAIRKEFLRRRGLIDHAMLRPPAAVLDRATLSAVDHVLHWSKLLDDKSRHPWK